MTRALFTVLVAAVAVERLVELGISRRNRSILLRRGGSELGAGHYPWMVAVHAGLLISAPAEVWLFDRPFVPGLALAAGLVFALATALRWWVIATLGRRWTTRIVVLPGAPLVRSGPFRWLRHPNYLAVALEVPALPLVHSAWLTASVFGLADLAVLAVRIREENRALHR